MGEFADMIVDDMYSYDGDHPGWGWGEDSGYSSYVSRSKTIKCNKCGGTNVYWHQHDSGKWCLFDKQTKKGHICPEAPPNVLKLTEKVKVLEAQLVTLRAAIRDNCTCPKKYWEKTECVDLYGNVHRYMKCKLCGKTTKPRW